MRLKVRAGLGDAQVSCYGSDVNPSHFRVVPNLVFWNRSKEEFTLIACFGADIG